VSIGLGALEEAVAVWGGEHGTTIEAHAVFVERHPKSFQTLREFVKERSTVVIPHVLEGAFGANASEIQQLLGTDPAFLFVDPTGWKGADMDFIAALAAKPWRDVLVNVMFDYLNRWIGAPLPFLREQLQRFFGLGEAEIPAELDEEGLMAFYRDRLKARCRLEWAADLAIPYGDRERTFFRLVVGGHDPEVVRLFRDVEERVVGKEAATVREAAKQRRREGRTGQTELTLAPSMDARYRQLRARDLPRALAGTMNRLRTDGPLRFGEIWPYVLESQHLTRTFLAKAILEEVESGRLAVRGTTKGERSLKDDHILLLASRGADSDAPPP
jgi:three-Cys-motif partner protein